MTTNLETSFPPAVFYFNLLFDDITGVYEAGFETLSGLDVKIVTENIQEGGANQFSHKIPKTEKYSNLVLKRGLIKDSPLLKWVKNSIENFTIEPKNIHVNLMDEKGDSLIRWSFLNAYPVAVNFSEFDTKENKYIVETLEIAYEYFIRTEKNDART